MSTSIPKVSHVPKLSERLRRLVARLAADPSPVVNRCYTLLLELDTSYSTLPPSFRQDYFESLQFLGRLWFNSLLTGTFPSAEELETAAATGRRRVHQGVTLASLLRAWRILTREIWSECLALGREDPGVAQELLFEVSRYLLEYFEVMSQTIAQAYLDEQYQRQRWRDSLRYELATVIFQFPEDVATFRRAAEGLGLDPTVPRIALALDLKLPDALPGRLEIEHNRIAVAAARHLKVEHDDIVRVVHRGRLVIWIPGVRGDSVIAGDQRVVEGATALLKAAPEIESLGIGLMNDNPSGWAASVDEAFKALDFGSRGRGSAVRRPHLYSDIAVNESVRRTDNVLRYLNSVLERLSTEPELLTTLQTYFDQLQRRKVTADVLQIHPNTLNNRLERIEGILGANLEDAAWIAKLHVALKLRQTSLAEDKGHP